MHLWRNEGGVPSVADAALITGGPMAALVGAVSLIDPILDVFEPHGLIVELLGYALIFAILAASVGGVVAMIWRTNKSIREEIIFPRLVFILVSPILAITANGIVSHFYSVRFVLENHLPTSSFTTVHYGSYIASFVVLGFAYLAVSRLALRFPETINRYAVYSLIGFSVLGVVAKIAKVVITLNRR